LTGFERLSQCSSTVHLFDEGGGANFIAKLDGGGAMARLAPLDPPLQIVIIKLNHMASNVLFYTSLQCPTNWCYGSGLLGSVT